MNTCDLFNKEYQQNRSQLPGQSLPWLVGLRDSAMASFIKQGMPGRRDENWKYTHIKQLEKQHYTQQLTDATSPLFNINTAELEKFYLSGTKTCGEYRLVFIDGRFNAKLSDLGNPGGEFVLTTLSQALQEDPVRIGTRLGKISANQEQPFTALNSAMMLDGLYLSVAPNCQIAPPVHCLFVATTCGQAVASYPRLLVELAENAQLTLVEHHIGIDAQSPSNSHFTNAVAELYLGPQAKLTHYMLQEVSLNTTQIGAMYVDQQRGSQFISHSYSLGSELARHDIQVNLNEPHAECCLYGLYFAEQLQHIDYHTQIAHLAPGCRSRQLYKGVVQDRGRAVFNGKVVIAPQAQQSDAQQLNNNLFFGEKAEVDTKPELQIYADDVKCSHGATVGQLDTLALFYFQSRGISKKDAETWLTYGFVSEVLQHIKDPDLREFIRTPVLAKLKLLVGGDISDLHENDLLESRLRESRACQD